MTEEFCTFHLDELFLGVETPRIHEVLRVQELTPVPWSNPALLGLINLRGHIVPIISLRALLGLPAAPEDHPGIYVLVRTAEGPVGLLVDRVGDVCEVSPDDFETVPDTLDGPARRLLRGAFKLTDRLLLSLDADRAADLASTDLASG